MLKKQPINFNVFNLGDNKDLIPCSSLGSGPDTGWVAGSGFSSSEIFPVVSCGTKLL
jgi:hypothetical protein